METLHSIPDWAKQDEEIVPTAVKQNRLPMEDAAPSLRLNEAFRQRVLNA